MAMELELKLTCDVCGKVMTIWLWSIEQIKEAMKQSKWGYIYDLREGHGYNFCPDCGAKVHLE